MTNAHEWNQHTVTLDNREWNQLLLALGAALAAARSGHSALTFNETLKLANAVNRDNPSFIPYREEPEEKLV